MRLFVLLLFISISANATGNKCASDHIHDAIEVNRRHKSLYNAGDEIAAAKVLNRLIIIEKLMLPFSHSLDRSAKELTEAGFTMWCEDFVSMDTIPDFQLSSTIPAEAFKAIDKTKLKDIRKKIKAFKMHNASALYHEIVLLIKTDLSNLHYNCVTRHFLESAARSLKLAIQREQSIPPELKKTFLKATRKMMKQMALALVISRSLDIKAAKVQANGVPVLCQEMPHIPY